MEYATKFRLHLGGEDQLPDPDLEAFLGVGNVNSYRGTAYIVFPNFDLTDRRESIPNFRFEVNGASAGTEITEIYDGFTGEGEYPPLGGFVFNPTDGESFPISIGGAETGSFIIQIFDEFTGFVPDEYKYTICKEIDGEDVPTSTFIIGAGFIGFNRADGDIFRLRADLLVPTPNTKMRYTYHVYDQTLEELIAENGGQPFFDGTLGSIVSSLHRRVQQPPHKYDVSELTDIVYGIVFAGDYTIADGIRAALTPYFCDSSEYDDEDGWKIHYIKRGKAVIKTLTEADLIDEPENAIRESAIEFPRIMHMFFQNPLIGYAPAKASIPRSSPDIRVVGESSVQVPVVYDNLDEAWQTADKLMKVSWAEAAGEVSFSVSDEQLELVPSDCIGLSLRGSVRRLRIVKIEDDPGTRKLTCRVDRQSAYTSKLTGIPLPPPTPPIPSIVGQSLFAYLDIPALTDNDDFLSYYDGAGGTTEAWYGAAVQRQDGVGDFDTINTFDSGTVIGTLQDAVGDASEHYTDTTNVLRVRFLLDPELDSLTNAQFLSEEGGLAVEKDDGTWELMQYRDAEQDSSLDYSLSTLHRGRLNSGTSSHSIGAKVVLLETVQRVSAVTSMIGTNLTHRAVSFGTSPEAATEYTDPFTAKSQTEWPVANLLLERAADDIIATAIPRHRFGTEDNPVRSINWSGYRWTATDGSNVITRDTLTDETTFDATGWASPVTVSVAQINRYTGAGPTVSEAIA